MSRRFRCPRKLAPFLSHSERLESQPVNVLSRLISLLLLLALLLISTPTRALAALTSRESAFNFSKRTADAPVPNDKDTADGVAETDIHAVYYDFQSACGGVLTSYLHNSEQLDCARGLYYLRARLMNPLTGRFWTADSFEGSQSDPQSLHKYLYANADPIYHVDPTGKFGLVDVVIVVGIIVIIEAIVTSTYDYFSNDKSKDQELEDIELKARFKQFAEPSQIPDKLQGGIVAYREGGTN